MAEQVRNLTLKQLRDKAGSFSRKDLISVEGSEYIYVPVRRKGRGRGR